MKYIALLLILASCAKIPIQQLPPDTVRIIDKQIHYKTEILVHDSIRTVTDTFQNFIFRDKIIYQTKIRETTDTIFSDKEVIRTNPLNEQLQQKNNLLEAKLKSRNKTILGLIVGFILLFLFYKIFK